eukprot:m51a1_g11211 hypothetical protein (237) ;mRNA; f:40209-40987
MELFVREVVWYDAAQYWELKSGSVVCRTLRSASSHNVRHAGRMVVCAGAEPRGSLERPGTSVPLALGAHVLVGEGALVEAAAVGSYVRIGDGAVLGRGVVVGDCCDIAPGAVVAPGTVVPSLTRVAGDPAAPVAELPPCWRDMMLDALAARFAAFRRKDSPPPTPSPSLQRQPLQPLPRAPSAPSSAPSSAAASPSPSPRIALASPPLPAPAPGSAAAAAEGAGGSRLASPPAPPS